MTDLERFVELYRSAGIECKVEKNIEGEPYIRLVANNNLDESGNSSIEPCVDGTFSKKIEGVDWLYTELRFDRNGKFRSQIVG